MLTGQRAANKIKTWECKSGLLLVCFPYFSQEHYEVEKKREKRQILAKVLTFRVKAEEELEKGRKTKVLKSYFKPPQPIYYHHKTEILPPAFLDLMRIRMHTSEDVEQSMGTFRKC